MASSIVDVAIRMLSHPLSQPISELSLLQQSLLFGEISSNPRGLFTFGGPRVGKNRYINFVSIPHYRWVNNNHIVARVPPPWLGYSHCGSEMHFNAFGRLRKYNPWRRFRDRWYGFFLSLRNWQIDHLADRNMPKYIESLQRALGDEAAGRIKPVLKTPPK